MGDLAEFKLVEWLKRTMKSEGYNKLREFQTKKVNQFALACMTKDMSERETDYARGAIEGYSCDIFDELLKEIQQKQELEKLEQEQEADQEN